MVKKLSYPITHGTKGATILLYGERKNGELFQDEIELSQVEWSKVLNALKRCNDISLLVRLDL